MTPRQTFSTLDEPSSRRSEAGLLCGLGMFSLSLARIFRGDDADLQVARISSARFEAPGIFDQVAQLALAIGSGIKVGSERCKTLTHPAERYPAPFIIKL